MQQRLACLVIALSLVLGGCATTRPDLDVFPDRLTLTARAGDTATGRFNLTARNSAPIAFELFAADAWLALTPPSGMTATAQTVEARAACPLADTDTRLSTSFTVTTEGGQLVLPVRLDCVVPRVSALEDASLSLSGLIGQTKAHTLAFTNPGEVSLAYHLSSDADWITFGAASGVLAAGRRAAIPFSLRCGAAPARRTAEVTLATDAPKQPKQHVSVTLTCRDALLPGEQGLIASLGSWNWGGADAAHLGSALLVGFRYVQGGATLASVTVRGPAGWNGDQVRTLELPGPDPDRAASQDVWLYDLLTSGSAGLPGGPYHLSAQTDDGNTYYSTLALEPEQMLSPPEHVAVTPDAAGVSVAWSPVPGAASYLVALTDPTDASQIVPANLQFNRYAEAFTASPSVRLEAQLSPDRAYQVVVVAFSAPHLLGATENQAFGVTAEPQFNASSVARCFTYLGRR